MKTFHIFALALAVATPVAAQRPTQGHAQHQASPSATTPQPADHTGHAQHQNDGQSGTDHSKHANCCGDANGNGKMDCCEGAAAAQRPCCAGHAEGGQALPDRPAQPQNH